jgi:phosphoglycerol transferase MdoB-like AlkP superfamily enzyme
MNTSLLPPPNRAASVAYADRAIPSLPKALRKAGYRAVTMHANDIAFWNRRELYSALGFDTYYDKAQFGEDDKMYRGASDGVFFDKAEGFIENELRFGQPLYVELVTLSSHAPYRGVPYDRQPLQLKKRWQGSRAGDWLGSLSYTDEAVGEFIDWLKRTGMYDTSVVIVYGDHTAIKDLELEGADLEIVQELLGRQYTEADRQRIPLLIHLPGQTEPRVIDSPVGQVDIAPTIADLLGVDLSETPHLGRSAFVNSNPFLVTRSYFPPGSFIDAQVLFMPGMSFADGTAFDVTDGWPATATRREYRDYRRASQLSDLSHEWVSGQPKRPDAGDISDAYIPVKSQRPGKQE